jgi:glycosyltransferase involved in cell wall biosynthesis
MRIVMVNWARISDGAALGGGVNVYAQQLALELVARGHEVMWLGSGQRYVGWEEGKPGACRVRRFEDWRGVRVFEVVNSPVVSPGPCQAAEPLGEVSAPALEEEVARFCRLVEPEVVHFHNIEGFSAGCVRAVRGTGARVVFSLHNYHTICPQVYLMQGGRRPCFDFKGGLACAGCIDLPSPEAERVKRAALGMPVRVEAPERAGLLSRFKSKPPPPEPPWPGRAVETFVDTVPERASVRAAAPDTMMDMESPEWEPLSNEVAPPPDPAPRNEFGTRRAAMVEMLSGCDRVVAVSNFVHRKFASMGVEPRKLVTLPIGSRMPQLASATPGMSDPPPPFDRGRPIRAVFMGYNNYFKGMPMLLDSLELLAPEYLAKIHLCVYAKFLEEVQARLEALRGRLGGLTLRGGYSYEDVPMMLCGKDVGLVPSVWWDNGPQTVMEFFACGLPVIGAELGGIPDLVKHGVNGLLHHGNDRFDLARTLAGVVREPGRLFEMRNNVRPPLTMGEHAGAVEALYKQCMVGQG